MSTPEVKLIECPSCGRQVSVLDGRYAIHTVPGEVQNGPFYESRLCAMSGESPEMTA